MKRGTSGNNLCNAECIPQPNILFFFKDLPLNTVGESSYSRANVPAQTTCEKTWELT